MTCHAKDLYNTEGGINIYNFCIKHFYIAYIQQNKGKIMSGGV